jgi:hypothetical protein
LVYYIIEKITMKNAVTILMILFICSIACNGAAQNSKLYLEPNKKYVKGRIYMKRNYNPISARNLTLVNDSILQYSDAVSGTTQSLNVYSSSVNYLKIKTGTRAGGYALYGGLLGGLCSLYGVLEAEKTSLDDYGETSGINWLPFVGGFTAGGALIGAIIGACSPKYKNFYIKDHSSAFILNVAPHYNPGGDAGVTVRLTF